MRSKHKSAVKSVVELVVTVAIAVGLALLIQAFIVKPYRIPSPSMVPTLVPGQRILTNRLINHPSIGDVVVFHPPARRRQRGQSGVRQPEPGHRPPPGVRPADQHESSQTFIKRVVAGPGDTISILNGHVYPQRRAGRRTPTSSRAATVPDAISRKPITIPPGDYFMMGDNRGDSDDSRFWGPVPDKWIIGVAFFTYWPPDRIGTL